MSKKILIIVPTLHHEADGVARFVIDFCSKMIESGSNMNVIALKWKGENLMMPFKLRMFDVSLGLYKIGFSMKMKKWINKQNAKSTYAIVHSQGLWMMPGIFSSKPALKRTYSLIISPHGSLSGKALSAGSVLKKPFWYLFQKKALESCDCFHVTSMAECLDIRKLGFKQPICIIPPGVDVPILQNKNIKKRKTLLFLARISPIKGIDILLKAWSRVEKKHHEWDLIIAGPSCDGYLSKMEVLSQQLELENVNFFGPVYGDEKEQLHIDSDLYILPSYSENFGITVAEALSYATPVITTKNTPWSGIVDIQAGWWIEATEDSLVACFNESLAIDSDNLEKMGISGRNWIASEFSWSATANKFNETYEWMRTKKNRPDYIKE